ncbi:hypothetical protein C0V97_07470 [Asaia sp. W19]|uniref:hypothetical protein n=1 Tax=unclassified Asaia TaxID=2685023 RepID=UPI000F8D3A03|nr:hypothetical protein [Asaia sp. W19]RUT26210.1 hypothetical protein C0V97_07470 [Asaia sp. W19]
MNGAGTDGSIAVKKIISRFMVLLEEENAQLRAGKPEAVEALLERKMKLSNLLEEALLRFERENGNKAALAPTMSNLIQRVAENQALLEHVSAAQTEFLKLICAPHVDEEQQAYSASGRYAARTAQSEALTLRSDI